MKRLRGKNWLRVHINNHNWGVTLVTHPLTCTYSSSLVPRPLPKRVGTHCMRMRVISVVTPTGFEEARAVCIVASKVYILRHRSRVVNLYHMESLLQSCAC